MMDGKNRELAVGDRVTIPANILKIDEDSGIITLETANNHEKYPAITMLLAESRHIFRAHPDDNNGIDAVVMEDAAAKGTAHFAGELASAQSRHETALAEMAVELKQKTNAHHSALARMEAELDVEKAKHQARLGVYKQA